MALSILTQLKHRQLLYGVSMRLSQENIKDMMYLAGVEQQLQESISSGTDFFTILEKKGLLGHHNYVHLISLLETIGRIDLIKTICSDHRAATAVALPPDKFPVAEQLAVMKRAQILQKRDLYLHSMQKLDTLHKSTSVHQQITESHLMQILSLLQIPEADSVHPSECFDDGIVGDLLCSVSLFHQCLHNMNQLFLDRKIQEFECLAVLCRQYWNDFHTKLPKDYAPLADSLRRLDLLEYTKDNLIGQTAVQVHQSLRDIFSELLGSPNLLTIADTSFNALLVSGQSHYDFANYLLPIGKWFLLLLQAIEQGHVNRENLQDTVLIAASNYRQLLVDNAKEIVEILGQDLTDKIMHSIPRTDEAILQKVYLDGVGAFIFYLLVPVLVY